MDDDPLAEKYRALLERIARYPVTDAAARAAILAEVEAAYRRERAASLTDNPEFRPSNPPGQGGT